MSTLLTRTARAVAAAAVLGGVAIGLAGPAAAEPTQPLRPAAGETRETCAAPVEGVQLCEVYTDVIPGQSSGDVHAELRTDAGVTIQAGLLTVDACSASCNSFRTAVGKDVTTLVSDSLPVGKGTGYYQVTGTWVVANHQHTGRV
jgi:hypothetical protein